MLASLLCCSSSTSSSFSSSSSSSSSASSAAERSVRSSQDDGALTSENARRSAKPSHPVGETPFVRAANFCFRHAGTSIARHPWTYLAVSTLLTLVAAARIPFTPMSNDVSDFTPSGARARQELKTYREFFANRGEPLAIFVLVRAKNADGNMLGLRQLEETVRLMDTVSTRFKIYNPMTLREESFLELCNSFCTINEPIRHFYNGLLVKRNFGAPEATALGAVNSTLSLNASPLGATDHIDLGYPITTVLGRQLHMDPNFFGVKVAIRSAAEPPVVVAAADSEASFASHAIDLDAEEREAVEAEEQKAAGSLLQSSQRSGGPQPLPRSNIDQSHPHISIGHHRHNADHQHNFHFDETAHHNRHRQAQLDGGVDEVVVSVNEFHSVDGHSIFDGAQLRDNIREIRLVGLQFRVERPAAISDQQLKEWERQIVDYVQHEFTSEFVDSYVLSEGLLTAEVVRAGLSLLPFLVVGFTIMVVFSSISMNVAAFYSSQLYPHKTILAVAACVCPFMACGTALGALFWAGFRFGSILCVTPFLVLALGVDDAFLMLNAWQRFCAEKRRVVTLRKRFKLSNASSTNATRMSLFSDAATLSAGLPSPPPPSLPPLSPPLSAAAVTTSTTTTTTIASSSLSSSASSTDDGMPRRQECRAAAAKRQVEELLSAVLIDTGASITITTLTNVLAFSIGALTPTPEIQLFSIGNTVAIIVDYIFEWTIFGAVMAIVGRYEFDDDSDEDEEEGANTCGATIQKNILPPPLPLSSPPLLKASAVMELPLSLPQKQQQSSLADSVRGLAICLRARLIDVFSRFVDAYCRMLTNGLATAVILAALVVYMYISIYGVLSMKAELKPEQLFLETSDVIKALSLRNEYIVPFYAICIVFVNSPGNMSNPGQLYRLHSLVDDFEHLPTSVGQFSTKFWLRDYEKFVEENGVSGGGGGGVTDFLPVSTTSRLTSNASSSASSNEIRQFLNWPEFSFWNGFLQLDERTDEVRRFFFTTASYGARLKEWSQRELLLNQWRRIADAYPELNVSIYEDDAKFLDLIPTMIPQTAQSSLWTLLCMFLVCLLFMTHPTTLLVANFAIFSSCVGVFGIMSLCGIDLDPIVMSSMIMSIGFSVDIPAHIAYHFYKSGVEPLTIHGGDASTTLSERRTVDARLRHCIRAVGFPILEAGLSTIVCVSSLMFVDLHMARVFSLTMILVVTIGLIHGLLVIPAMFYAISLMPTSIRFGGNRKRSCLKTGPPPIDDAEVGGRKEAIGVEAVSISPTPTTSDDGASSSGIGSIVSNLSSRRATDERRRSSSAANGILTIRLNNEGVASGTAAESLTDAAAVVMTVKGGRTGDGGRPQQQHQRNHSIVCVDRDRHQVTASD